MRALLLSFKNLNSSVMFITRVKFVRWNTVYTIKLHLKNSLYKITASTVTLNCESIKNFDFIHAIQCTKIVNKCVYHNFTCDVRISTLLNKLKSHMMIVKFVILKFKYINCYSKTTNCFCQPIVDFKEY